MAKPVKNIFLGNFPLGNIGVDVYAQPMDTGGLFDSRDDVSGRPTIYVGCAENWGYTVGVLLHEAEEGLLLLKGYRHIQTNVAEDDGNTGLLFVFSHDQYTDVMDGVGRFAALAIPALAKVHREIHSKKAKS